MLVTTATKEASKMIPTSEASKKAMESASDTFMKEAKSSRGAGEESQDVGMNLGRSNNTPRCSRGVAGRRRK